MADTNTRVTWEHLDNELFDSRTILIIEWLDLSLIVHIISHILSRLLWKEFRTCFVSWAISILLPKVKFFRQNIYIFKLLSSVFLGCFSLGLGILILVSELGCINYLLVLIERTTISYSVYQFPHVSSKFTESKK